MNENVNLVSVLLILQVLILVFIFSVVFANIKVTACQPIYHVFINIWLWLLFNFRYCMLHPEVWVFIYLVWGVSVIPVISVYV